MATNNVKFIIETNDKEACNGINNINEKLGEMSNQIKRNSNIIGENTLKWSIYSQGITASLELLKKASSYAKSAFDYLREGANFAEAEQNFRAYTKSIGKNADELVSRFRKATRNQISDVELMKSATKALRVAGINDIEALEKIYQIADTKGDLLGLSLQETFDKIVSAISSGNGRALVELGVLPEKFAKASTSADLLKNRASLLKEVIKQSEADFKALNSVGDTSSDKFNQLEAAVSNLNREFKIELSEALIPIIDFVKTEGVPIAKSSLEWFKDVVKNLKKVEEESELLTDAIKITTLAFGTLTAASIISGLSNLITSLKAAKDAQISFNLACLKNPYVIMGALGAGSIIYTGKIGYDTYSANKQAEKNMEMLKNSSYEGYRAKYDEWYYTEELKKLGNKQALLNKKEEIENALSSVNVSEMKSGYEYKALVTDRKDELEKIEKELSKIEEYETKLKNAKTIIKEIHDKMKEISSENSDDSNTIVLPEPEITADKLDKTNEKITKSSGFFGTLSKSIKDAGIETKKTADEIERLFKSFDDEVFSQNVVTEFEHSLENISNINLNSVVSDFKDISTYMGQINALGLNKFSGGLVSNKSIVQEWLGNQTSGQLGMNYFGAIIGGMPGDMSRMIIGKKTKENIAEILDNPEIRQDIKETSNYLHDQFASGIANAIADGFASADFSGFASSLQSVISGVVGNGISSSLTEALTKKSSGNLGGLFKEVVDKNNKVSWSNLGSNLLTGGLISTATNFLFGEGGIFGKTKIVGKENLNKSAELNAQVDQAKELAESIYLATGISDYTRELIDNAVYNKTWTTTSKSKNPFKKKKTISLHGAAEAQASIKYVEDLQKQALGEQALFNYNNYMLGRDNSVMASYENYQEAQKAYDASQVMTYSTEENAGFQSQIDAKLAQISNLNSQKNIINKNYNKAITSKSGNYYANQKRNVAIGVINNQITNLNNEISSLREKLNAGYKYDLETRTEMLKQMEEAHVNYIKAQQDARSSLLSSFTGSSTLGSLVGGNSSESVMDMLLGNKDVVGNSDMVQTMLPLLEQSYMKDYDLNQRLNSSDDKIREEAMKEQQSILEKALSSYEKIYKDAKDEALNTNLTTEEQSAAFERWQESFQAYLSLQEQIAENTKTIADLEESNALSKLSTELGDMLSVVAEIKNQKSTNNTLVFRQSMNVEEIIGKLKEVAGAKNPELASVLGEILNDRQNQSVWG